MPDTNLNSVSIQNNEIILKDTFKCALNIIPRAVNSFDCGLMDLQCRVCIGNIELRNLIDLVISKALHYDTTSNVFCLADHAVYGKTFT